MPARKGGIDLVFFSKEGNEIDLTYIHIHVNIKCIKC